MWSAKFMMAALALHEGLDANDTEKAGGGL